MTMIKLTAMFRPCRATMTVEDLRDITKAVIEHPKIPKKAKDKLDFILGFLDGIIERKDLGQIRGFEKEG